MNSSSLDSVQSGNSIAGIQYLRGIAAILVVALHARELFPQASTWFSFGNVGVDIFFVISGFVMAHSTRRFSADSKRSTQAADFFLRRLLRIVPLYWIALLWTAKVTLISGNAHMSLLKDFLFIPRLLDGGEIWPILVPGWTINYEMFFYAIFGVSMLFGNMRYWATTAVLVSFCLIGLLHNSSSVALRFYASSIELEFLYGIALYFVTRRAAMTPSGSVSALVFLTAFAGLTVDYDPVPRAFSAGPLAAALVWSSISLFSGTRWRIATYLGNASYSIYLFHFAAFGLVRHFIHHNPWDSQAHLPPVVAIVGAEILGIGAGCLMHEAIERPLMDRSRRMLMRAELGAAPAARAG